MTKFRTFHTLHNKGSGGMLWWKRRSENGQKRRNIAQPEVFTLCSMFCDPDLRLPNSNPNNKSIEQAESQPSTTTAQENLPLGDRSPEDCCAFTPVDQHSPGRSAATGQGNFYLINPPTQRFNGFTFTSSPMIGPLYVVPTQEALPLENSTVSSATEEIQNPESDQQIGNEMSSRLNWSHCNMSFENAKRLYQHKADHHDEYECNECSKVFVNRSNPTVHMDSHTTPFECPQCHKKFGRKQHLKRHTRIHTGEKPCICDKCDRSFAEKPDLDKHMRRHTGERPFLCDKCNGTFAQSSALCRHRLTHTGEKPHKCDKCGKGFATRWNWRIHRKRHRPGE